MGAEDGSPLSHAAAKAGGGQGVPVPTSDTVPADVVGMPAFFLSNGIGGINTTMPALILLLLAVRTALPLALAGVSPGLPFLGA